MIKILFLQTTSRKMPTLAQIYTNRQVGEVEMSADSSDPTNRSFSGKSRTFPSHDTANSSQASASSNTVFNFEVTPPPDTSNPVLPDVVPQSYRRRLRHHRRSLTNQPSRFVRLG